MRLIVRLKVWSLLVILCPLIAQGGQSLRLTTAQVANGSVRAQSSSDACRMEWSLHDWSSAISGNSHPVEPGACGLDVQFLNLGNGDIRIQIYQRHSQGQSYAVCQISLNRVAVRFANIRYQHVPGGVPGTASGSSNSGIDTCEAWDIEGKRFSQGSLPYTEVTRNTEKGVSLSGSGGFSTAYFRLFTTTVPMGTRPPVTADKGDLLEWKFDGNLSDASGHSYNGSVSDGPHSYQPTPGQDLVVAAIRTANAPPWSDWIPLRVGSPNQLDCGASYSQADQSSQVSCEWSASGPSALVWSSTTARNPTLTGISFGTYDFQLKITDAAGVSATQHLAIGAVAYDDQGVVIPSDPRVTQIFGPMIALGQNPWGYADERSKRMVELQHDYFVKNGLEHPVWSTPGQGTVRYIYTGIGPSPSLAGTALTRDLSAQAEELAITDAGKLPGLATLPTWILVGNSWGSQELIRICSTSALQGPAALTVCYDGRGMSGASVNNTQTISQAWPAGTSVGEYRVQGSGTRFVSDAQRPICPGGAPGPAGPVAYTEGSVTLTGGSTHISGAATVWTPANGVAAGRFIRVEATHGGVPFVYWSRIATLEGPTGMIVDRPLPADTDAGSYAYKIIGYRFIALEFTAPDGALQYGLQATQGCESEELLFASAMHDLPAVNQTTMTGMHFSYKDSLGIQSAFGPNFYGSGLAARAVYFRSGWDLAKQTADMIDEHWVRDPEIAGGWRGGIPLLQGGAVIGAIADLVTNRDTQLRWSDVRAFARGGASVGRAGCNAIDTRDSGYLSAWLILAANFDPDDQPQQEWQQALQQLLARDTNCQREDASWANGFIFNNYSPALTVTPGSDIAHGEKLQPGLCFGIASGTLTVTTGSAAIQGEGLVKGSKIVITGTREGRPFVGIYQFVLLPEAGSGILSVLWPGDSGTATFVIDNNESLTTIAENNQDPQLSKNWTCTYISSTQLQLNRAWDGPATNQAHIYSYALAGFGQQPYMLGIKITAMQWAAQNRDPAIALAYQDLAGKAAQWMRSTGYDPVTQGLHYGRLFGACESDATPTPTPAFDYRTPGCSYGLTPGGIRAARTLTAEASSALTAYYLAEPTPERQAWGDQAYGSIWGYCPYTKPGYYCDPHYVRDENSDGALGGYKWSGFFFGMGMAHQWPAARQGNTPPVRRR